jgi:LysB family phage lysis regulatory protein
MTALRAIAIAVIIGLVGVLLVGIQQYRLIALQGDLTIQAKATKDAVDANKESEAAITTLRAEAKRNADYSADLSKRLKASEDKAKQARKDFEELKRNNKPVRDWANQPLPDGLRGKPATVGGKDDGGKAAVARDGAVRTNK